MTVPNKDLAEFKAGIEAFVGQRQFNKRRSFMWRMGFEDAALDTEYGDFFDRSTPIQGTQ